MISTFQGVVKNDTESILGLYLVVLFQSLYIVLQFQVGINAVEPKSWYTSRIF